MRLPFLDRRPESERPQRLIRRREGSLGVLYGRRRCGKSRLLREQVAEQQSAYFVEDDREAALQRSSLALEMDRAIEGFAQVTVWHHPARESRVG